MRDGNRVAIYARVSTSDGRQTTENQLLQLRDYCESQGLVIAGEYVDEESGRKGRDQRKAFDQLFKDASGRRFDLVLVWALDRFTRQGYRAARQSLWLLDDLGIRFRSFTQPIINTDVPMVAELMLTLLAQIAEDESSKISMRTKAGHARARKAGVHIGRSSGFALHKEHLIKAREANLPKKQVARQLGLTVHTVRAYYKQLDTKPTSASPQS